MLNYRVGFLTVVFEDNFGLVEYYKNESKGIELFEKSVSNLKKNESKRDDVRTLLLEHVKPDNSQLKEYLKSGPGAFLLEKLLFTMNDTELRHFYDSWIRGRLEELFMHEKGKEDTSNL